MPVRQIKPGRRAVRGYFPSRKNRRQIAFESTFERDFYFLLEMNPKVKSFEEQPIRVTLELEEETTTYVPDTFVLWHGSKLPTVVEIKPKSSDFPESKRKAMEAWCNENGSEFKVVDESNIRTPELKRAKFLYPYMRLTPAEKMVNEILKLFAANKTLSVHDIVQRSSCNAGVVYYLIAVGKLRCNGMPDAKAIISINRKHS